MTIINATHTLLIIMSLLDKLTTLNFIHYLKTYIHKRLKWNIKYNAQNQDTNCILSTT